MKKIIFILNTIALLLSQRGNAQNSFCPGCLGPAPCSTTGIGDVSITCAEPDGQLGYILIFNDNFTGSTLDLNKWWFNFLHAPNQIPLNGGHNPIAYDNRLNNMQFNNPGLSIVDKNVPTFYARVNDQDMNLTMEPDGMTNIRPWNYTTANLNSMFFFPSLSPNYTDLLPGYNVNLQYGIYQLTCVLPSDNVPNPYQLTANETGSIWPAFWMQWEDPGYYSEADGFEFTHSEYQDFQTSHAPEVSESCPSTVEGYTVDPEDINFGDGISRIFSLIQTPQEIDWWVGDIPTRIDDKYFYSYKYLGIFPPTTHYPYVCNNLPPTVPDYLDVNTAFTGLPMQLNIGNGVQYGANPSVFPVSMNIQSVKYYQLLPCSGTQNVVPTEINNTDNHNTAEENSFNVFTGGTVNLNCGAAGLVIPSTKNPPYSLPWLGQLELIAADKIVITGGFTCSGYFVARLDGNLCNEYNGTPLPGSYQNPINPGIEKQPSDTVENNTTRQDSLGLMVKQSTTRGIFSIVPVNFSQSEQSKNASVTVYDMLGQMIFKSTLLIESNNTLDIDLSSQPKGVYLVVLRTDDQVCEKKIVLQ